MFSGIVRDVGTFGSIRSEGAGRRAVIRTSFPFTGVDAIQLGDSIAVQGTCLTVDRLIAPDGFEVVIGQETMALTTLGLLTEGARVNLERSLRLADRLDGHLVLGHVDGVAAVQSLVRSHESLVLWIDAPPELGRYIATKGSIAVDGVSLTVNEVTGPATFRVNLIPFTADHTTLGSLTSGSRVNLEVDLVARYVLSRV